MIAANAIAATCCFHWWFAAPLSILLTGLSIGFVESTQARNKLVRNTTFIVTISALAALIFFIGYLLQSDINI
jgi:1,4-dihydroxy-2-naphthoate octaprenyltransferase